MACDSQTLIDAAYANGYAKPSDRDLRECILAAACAGGGGGGGSGAVLQDATGGPPPDPTKPAISFPTGGGGISEWDVASQTWI